MNKDTLAREIGNYFLNYIRVPRTKKNFIDPGRRHYNGFRIRHYHGTPFKINQNSKQNVHNGDILMRRPKSLAEFLFYYSKKGARVPRRDSHGKILRDSNNRMLHKRIHSQIASDNEGLIESAFFLINSYFQTNLRDTDNFQNKK